MGEEGIELETAALVEMAYELETICNDVLLHLEEHGMMYPGRLADLFYRAHEQLDTMEDWL